MEAILKDSSKLLVNQEERIYATVAPGMTIPIIIDQVVGEQLLIELAENQQHEIGQLKDDNERLKNLAESLKRYNQGLVAKLEEIQ
jgi:predicted RNase H-like nuclease (RuvC/YqgF family)